MATHFETPASPLDDGPRPEPEFIAGPAHDLETPASPPLFQDPEVDLSRTHTRLSFRDISPPASKRPRLDPSGEENLKIRINLPHSNATDKANRNVPISLGSSSSPTRRPGPVAPRAAGTNMAPRHYAMHTPFSLSENPRGYKTAPTLLRHNSGSAIPTAPKALLHRTTVEQLEKSSLAVPSRSERSSSLPRSINAMSASKATILTDAGFPGDLPSVTGPPFIDDQGSKKSASEVSSIDPPPETCVNCRFPLSNKSTLRCHGCSRSFHVTCKMDSKLLDGKWKCARCLKREAKRANSSTAKVANKLGPVVPKTTETNAPKNSRSPTPFGLPADRYSYHARAQTRTLEQVKSTEKLESSVPHRSRSSTPLVRLPTAPAAMVEDVAEPRAPPSKEATRSKNGERPSSAGQDRNSTVEQALGKVATFSTEKRLVSYSSSSRPSSRGQDNVPAPHSNKDSIRPVPSADQPATINIAGAKSANRTFLRDAGFKPKGNVFANGTQLKSREGETSSLEHRPREIEETPEGTETEASMEMSDVEFTEADLLTSTPMPKPRASVDITNETFTWSQNESTTEVPLATELIPSIETPAASAARLVPELPLTSGTAKAKELALSAAASSVSGAVSANEIFPSAAATRAAAIAILPPSAIDTPRAMTTPPREASPQTMETVLPKGLPTIMEAPATADSTQLEDGEVPASPLRLDTSARVSTPKPPDLSTPTADADAKSRLDYLSKFKVKKRTSIDHMSTEATKSPTQHTKPSGVPGWSRAFRQAGCEDPFKDAGSPSVKLNYCEDIYNLFGKCPWELVNRDLRPKRFKLELLKALANLKNVLHRFDDVNACLERLETFIVERRMSGQTDLGVPKLTTGDVMAFIEIMAARAVKGNMKKMVAEPSKILLPNASSTHATVTENNSPLPEANAADHVQITTNTLRLAATPGDPRDLNGGALAPESTPAPPKTSSPATRPESRKAARKSVQNQRKTPLPVLSLPNDSSGVRGPATPSLLNPFRKETQSPSASATPSEDGFRTPSLGLDSPLQAYDDPGKKTRGFERYVHKKFSTLLAGSIDQAPLSVSEVATLALTLAPMEQYTDTQLAEQPTHVQALVTELRSMTALRQEAKILAQSRNSFTAEQGRTSLKSMDDMLIQKAVHWAVDNLRTEQRVRTENARREAGQFEAEIRRAKAKEIATIGSLMNGGRSRNDMQREDGADIEGSINDTDVDSLLNTLPTSTLHTAVDRLRNRRASYAYVEDVSDEEDHGVLNSLPPEHATVLEQLNTIAERSVFAAAEAREPSPDKQLDTETTAPTDLDRKQVTASAQHLGELLASTSRAQSPQAGNFSQSSELTSDLSELEDTPEPPSHVFRPERASAAPRLNLRFSAHENAARSNGKDTQTINSGKPSRGFTQFSFRELILLALYEEPQRLYGRKALLPRLTSKSVVQFVLDKFPSYSDPAHQLQRDHLFNNIAAQCSTHVARGILGKEASVIPETGKLATFYYADTSASKWLSPEALRDLSSRYRKHLAETFPDDMKEDQSKQAMQAKKRTLSVPETPSPKRLKLTKRLPKPSEPESEQSDHEVRHNSTVRAPRKAIRVTSSGKPKDADKTPRIPQSASRMMASGQANFESPMRKGAISSSSDHTIPDSVLEADLPSRAAPAVRAQDRDEPQANIADPLDALLESSKTLSAEEQELLDHLSTMCDKEAASDAFKMAEKKFEVVDFFEHWPQHHPSNVLLFDTETKLQEIEKRPNRRQMMGRPCKTATPIHVYRPYEGISAPLLPGSEHTSATTSFGFGNVLRNASPNKQKNNISPRKRRAMRIDDSNIYADEIDDTVLEQAASMGGHVKEARSWQEALGIPKALEIGFLEDPLLKRDKRLVLEVPAAERGKTRNWFKAILPGD